MSPPKPRPKSCSDTPSVLVELRRRIIEGEFAAGTRMAEIPVSEALGVSRMPVRLAIRTLEHEGLLEKAGKRGFVVRTISDVDVQRAIEVRGVLEGMAARHLAERGLAAQQLGHGAVDQVEQATHDEHQRGELDVALVDRPHERRQREEA